MKEKFFILTLSCLVFSSCHKPDKTHDSHSKNIIEKFEPPSPNSSFEVSAKNWGFPELTEQEKEHLISSVQTVFNDFYVHRTQKKQDYQYDSQGEANKLSTDMSSETLLRSVNSIFNNIRDLHTGFMYPVPTQCFVGGFPLEVGLAYERDQNGLLQEKLIIKEKASETLWYATTSQDKKNFELLEAGDEILAISNLGLEGESQDELSTAEALKKLEAYARGANVDAAKTRAVEFLFSRHGAYLKPPVGRFKLKIKNYKNEIFWVEFPWMTGRSYSPECYSMGNVELSNNFIPKFIMDNTLKSNQNNLNLQNNAQLNYKRRMGFETFKDVYSRNKRSDTNVTAKILKFNGKNIAFIHMDYFMPADYSESDKYLVSRKKVIKEFNRLRNFVLSNKDKIDGIIFDMRENGGGFGVYPQLIANMFTTEFVSNGLVQPLVSKMNRDTFHNLEFSRYFTRLGTVDPLVDKNNVVLTAPQSETADEMDYYLNDPESQGKEIILAPADRFDEDENDALPPEYTAEYKRLDTVQGQKDKFAIKEIFTDKPIAVLTSSNCYSACDIFVAIMKDYNIAKIFGETAHTGGGGANVVEWKNFVKPVLLDANGTKGPIIPNGKVLPKGMSMRFAWNRLVRHNAKDQELERYIEGVGVLVPEENVFKPTVNDVLHNGRDALNKIMKDMVENPESYNTNR